MKSSFVRKGKAAATAPALPPGTRLSAQNGSLQISSGLADFDEIMSGGLMVGSLILVEEDVFSDYNQLLLKYFASEGVACRQQTYVASVASEEDAAASWIRKLPFVSGAPPSLAPSPESKPEPSPEVESTQDKGDNLKIAWQYKKYMGAETMHSSRPVAWCHSFDLMKNMEASYLTQCEIISRSFVNATGKQNCYKEIYDELNRIIFAANESIANGGPPKITRIILPSIGSVKYNAKTSGDDKTVKKAILEFLRALRGLLRQSLATCVFSFPSHLFSNDQIFLQRLRHVADAAVQFSAFSDSSDPVSPAFENYDGIFTVLKVPRIGSLASSMPSQPSFTFQFKRKKLYIEKIHLPPDMSVLEDKKSNAHHSHDHSSSPAGTLLCSPSSSSASSSSLDF
jgi:elongator complex protein 4